MVNSPSRVASKLEWPYFGQFMLIILPRRDQFAWAQAADQIIQVFRPRRVFDAGRAHGFSVEALCDRSVEAWGRDISDFAVPRIRPDPRPYCSMGGSHIAEKPIPRNVSATHLKPPLAIDPDTPASRQGSRAMRGPHLRALVRRVSPWEGNLRSDIRCMGIAIRCCLGSHGRLLRGAAGWKASRMFAG